MYKIRSEKIGDNIIHDCFHEHTTEPYINNIETSDSFEKACERLKFELNPNIYDAGNGVKFLWNKGCQDFIILQFPYENPIYISSEKLMNFIEDIFYSEYCEDRFEDID